MENMVSRLRAGLIATSLSAALMVGGAAISASAQQQDQDRHAPSATPAQTMPGDNAQQPAAVPQTAPDQDNGVRPAPDKDRDMQANPADRDRDRDKDRMKNPEASENKEMRKDVKEFDSFLDSHPGVAKDLQRDPSKINDEAWVSAHPELENWLKEHKNVREEIKENPNAFMNHEKSYERNDENPKH